MSSFKTKKQIHAALMRGKVIKLDSSNTANAAVSFSIEKNYPGTRKPYSVKCGGFGTIPEKEIDDVEELVSYIYQERKRIIDVI